MDRIASCLVTSTNQSIRPFKIPNMLGKYHLFLDERTLVDFRFEIRNVELQIPFDLPIVVAFTSRVHDILSHLNVKLNVIETLIEPIQCIAVIFVS